MSTAVSPGPWALNVPRQPRNEVVPAFQLPLDLSAALSKPKVMELSPFDQIILRQVTRFLLCFKSNSSAATEEMLETLRIGLARACEQLPFLGGSVQYSDDPQNKVKIVYNHNQKADLKVVDVSGTLLSYDTLKNRNFPPSELKEGLLSPLPNFIHPKQRSQPVLVLQANILDGGLILCVCVHHTVFDGVGQGLLMRLLSAYCAMTSNPADADAIARVSEFSKTVEELTIRNDLFSNVSSKNRNLLHDYKEYHIPDPSTISPIDNRAVRPCTARLFIIKDEKINKLKTMINDGLTAEGQKTVSCHDALGALAWHCVTKARLACGKIKADTNSQLVVPINCRPYLSDLGIPTPYLGNAALCLMPEVPVSTIATSNITESITTTLTHLAVTIRNKITLLTPSYILGLAYHAQMFDGDLNTIKPLMQSYLGPDVTFVSWAGFGAPDWDFGQVIGKIDVFRCPWRALDGVVKVLPRAKDEEWEVVVEMEVDVMDRLLEDDGEWMKWVDSVVL